jgi:hypothetical protein
MTVIAGTTIASAGIESLSTIARKVSKQICDRNRATLSEQSTIEIFENGQVRENLIIEMHKTLKFEIELIDGRLTGFTSINEEETYSYLRPAEGIQIWLSNTPYYEMMSNYKFDNQEADYQTYMEKLDEANLLHEMMWDTDKDFPEAAWGRLTILEQELANLEK